MKRNRRAGVEDRWTKTVRDEDGNTQKVPSARHGKGLRWIARYVDGEGREQTKSFDRKVDAQRWLDKQVSDQVTGTWTDPALSTVSFGMMAQRWLSTKATRAPKTVAGYRSLLDTVVLPGWKDVPLREVRFDDLQVWITDLSVDGSVRFEGKGLSASRVRQAHQLVGAVLKFAVKAKHLAANPADGVELPRLPEIEQRYLTHEQLHRVAVASGRLRTLVFVLGYCGLRFGEATALQVADVDVSARRIRVRRSVTYVRKTGLVEGPTKNHSSRVVPAASVCHTAPRNRDRRPRWHRAGVRVGTRRRVPDARAGAVFVHQGGDGGRRDRRGAATRSAAHLRLAGDLVGREHQGRPEAAGPQVGSPHARQIRPLVPRRPGRRGDRFRRCR